MQPILFSSIKLKQVFALFLFLLISKFSFEQTLDSSFGVNGRQVVAQNAQHLYIRSAAAQDKKIITGGYFEEDENQNYPIVHVWRFTPGGSLDSGFEEKNRMRRLSTGTYVVVQPDNKIVIAGDWLDEYAFNSHWEIFVTRFLPDGRPDKSFGKKGTVRIYFNAQGSFTSVNAIALRPDGKLIVTGVIANGRGDKIALVQLLPNGDFDSSFGRNGVLYQAIPELRWGLALKILPGNKILVGFDAPYSKHDDQNCLIRYTPKGKIDSSFGTNGIVFNGNPVQGGTNSMGLTVQNDGRILEYVKATPGNLLLRYNADGSVDHTFGINGRVEVADTSIFSRLSVAVDSNENILVNTGPGFNIARYLPDGKPDSTFGVNGLLSADFSDLYEGEPRIDLVLLQPDNKILGIGTVWGYTNGYSDERLALVRFNNPGIMRKSFINSNLLQKKIATGVNENVILIYPNPVKDVLHVTGLNANTNYELKIIEATGKLVSRREVKGNCNYNVQQLSKGVYYLSIISNKQTTTVKFVKE